MKSKKHTRSSRSSRRRNISSFAETRDLRALVVSRTFAAVVAGMLLYTLVEYLIDRPADWPVFLTHHVLHVAVIGVAVWVVSAALISHLVIKPVDHLFLHLHRIASGRFEYLDVEVGSTQLSGVVGSVNALVARLRRTPEGDSVSRALDHIRELRVALRERMNDSDDSLPIMRLMTKLEAELFNVMQEHSDTPCPDPNLHELQLQST